MSRAGKYKVLAAIALCQALIASPNTCSVFKATVNVLCAAAAAAGSGILAKKLITPKQFETPSSNFGTNSIKNESLVQKEAIFHSHDAFQENMEGVNCDGEIFRFSTPKGGAKCKKKSGSGFKGMRKNGGGKKVKKIGLVEGGEKDMVASGRVRKVSVCLKKRRVGKNGAGKCACASKDKSFSWGVGLGIMYMMSAGKAEMSKLNSAMDETAKVVQELKHEISRKKILSNEHALIIDNETEMQDQQNKRSLPNNKVTEPGPSFTREGMYRNNEQLPEVMEMDQLEAEFEAELQKLPWCATDSSGSGGTTDRYEAEVLARDHQNSDVYQYNGVSPVELDEKLCHLLIGQQESQIGELEADLHNAHSKLHEKEAELQALKDCVKRLTHFSLTTVSDDEETDDNINVSETRGSMEEKVKLELAKPMVGTKRTMSYESYICSADE